MLELGATELKGYLEWEVNVGQFFSCFSLSHIDVSSIFKREKSRGTHVDRDPTGDSLFADLFSLQDHRGTDLGRQLKDWTKPRMSAISGIYYPYSLRTVITMYTLASSYERTKLSSNSNHSVTASPVQ